MESDPQLHIAQTELARAHQDKVGAEFMQDAALSVVKVIMAPGHPVADICDLHARADLFGLEPGCYPKARAPKPPFHLHCRCVLSPHPSLDARDAREVPGGAQAYLRSLPPAQAARVMGSQARAFEVMQGGRGVDEVINKGVYPAYHLTRLGQLDLSVVHPARITLGMGMNGNTPKPQPMATQQNPAIFTKVNSFQDQKTASAAAKCAVDNNLADFADYTGIKPEVANAWNKSLFDHLQEFPELRKNQKFTGTCQAQFTRWREIEIERVMLLMRTNNPQYPAGFDFRPSAEAHVKPKKLDGQPRHYAASIARIVRRQYADNFAGVQL